MAHVLFTLLALAATSSTVLATQANQIAFPYVRTIAFARLDPIVFPGQVSGHVHKFVGASKVSDTADFGTLQESECTTHPIQADLSSYWMPAFYHVSDDGYRLLDSGDNIVYYGTAGDNVTAFPDNFSMVTGSPTQTCDEGPDRYFVCIKETPGDVHLSKTIPHEECTMIGGHITFPSCWTGKDFTLETQNENLVDPTDGPLGSHCPASHPVKLPSLMVDFWANATGLPVNPNGPTYALSFGDTVGCGLHADFMNGWDRSVLQDMMTECKDFNGDMDVRGCAPIAKYYNREREAECKFQSPVPNENIGLTGTIPKLVYCSTEESDEACAKQDEGINFVSDTTTIDVLGMPLPIAVPQLHPESSSSSSSSSSSHSHEPTSSASHSHSHTPTSSASSSTHKTSPTSTQRMATSTRPKPTSSSVRSSSSARPTAASPSSAYQPSFSMSGFPHPSDTGFPHPSGTGFPHPSGTGFPRPPGNGGAVGPIHRPPPGGDEGGGDDDGGDPGDDGC